MTDPDDTDTVAQVAEHARHATESAFSLRATWAGLDGDEVSLLDAALAHLTEARSVLAELAGYL